jgi:hypothetical protein
VLQQKLRFRQYPNSGFMFSLLNFVTVLPVAGVEFVEQYFQKAGFPHPVILREQPGMPGHVCLVAWDPERGPIQYLLPCEVLACREYRSALAQELGQFLAMAALDKRPKKTTLSSGSGRCST